MVNLLESVASGLGKAIGSIFHAPVDFLAGKSCSSVCAPTWDLTCYIENFCIANLLKLALILVLVYMVLLFIYLTYKLGVFHCLLCCVFKSAWTCCSTCAQCCHCLLHQLSSVERRPRRPHVPNSESSDSTSHASRHGRGRSRRNHPRGHLIRRSLRPRSHRVRVRIRGTGYTKSPHGHHDAHRSVRVTPTTKFAHKASRRKM